NPGDERYDRPAVRLVALAGLGLFEFGRMDAVRREAARRRAGPYAAEAGENEEDQREVNIPREHPTLSCIARCAFKRPRSSGSHYASPGAPEMTQPVTTFIKLVKAGRVELYIFRAVGLFGAAIFVVAYFANQARWLSAHDWRFPAANLAG